MCAGEKHRKTPEKVKVGKSSCSLPTTFCLRIFFKIILILKIKATSPSHVCMPPQVVMKGVKKWSHFIIFLNFNGVEKIGIKKIVLKA